MSNLMSALLSILVLFIGIPMLGLTLMKILMMIII